ncbi:MAG: DUF4116 domain-containing protein [Candidatus Margulisiibacteriota bacterium]
MAVTNSTSASNTAGTAAAAISQQTASTDSSAFKQVMQTTITNNTAPAVAASSNTTTAKTNTASIATIVTSGTPVKTIVSYTPVIKPESLLIMSLFDAGFTDASDAMVAIMNKIVRKEANIQLPLDPSNLYGYPTQLTINASDGLDNGEILAVLLNSTKDPQLNIIAGRILKRSQFVLLPNDQTINTSDGISNEELNMALCSFAGNTVVSAFNSRLASYKEQILSDIQNGNYSSFSAAPDIVKNDESFVLAAVSKHEDFFNCIPDIFKNNSNFVCNALSLNPDILKSVPALCENKDYVLAALGNISKDRFKTAELMDAVANHYAINGKPNNNNPIFNNIDFAKKAVNIMGQTFKYLENFHDNREIALDAIRMDCYEYIYASDNLKNSADFQRDAVFADPFLGNPLNSSWMAITSTIKTYYDLFNSINNQTSTFKNYDASLRGNKELIKTLVAGNTEQKHSFGGKPEILSDVTDSIKGDRSFLLSLVSINGKAVQYIPAAMQNDIEFIRAAVYAPYDPGFYSKDARLANNSDNKSFAIDMFKRCIAVGYFPLGFEDDRDVAFAAISNNPNLFSEISNRLKKDPEIINKMIMMGRAKSVCSPGTISNKNIILESIKMSTSYPNDNLKYATPELLNDRTFALQVIARNNKAFSRFSSQLTNDAGFQKSAVYSNMNVISSISTASPGYKPAQSAYTNVKNALEILNIEWPSRFCNTKEIIRNRYSVSSPAVQKQLIDCFGPDAQEYFKDIDKDTRPVLIAAFPKHDGVGGVFVSSDFNDATTKYKVIYYESSSDLEFSNNILEATKKTKASVIQITGHGSQGSTLYKSIEEDQIHLDGSDTTLFYQLSQSLVDQGKVMLLSCSTGQGGKGGPGINNMVEFVHRIWPNSFTYAPQDDTEGKFSWDKDGYIDSMLYYNTSTFIIPPDKSPASVGTNTTLNTLQTAYGTATNGSVKNALAGIINNLYNGTPFSIMVNGTYYTIDAKDGLNSTEFGALTDWTTAQQNMDTALTSLTKSANTTIKNASTKATYQGLITKLSGSSLFTLRADGLTTKIDPSDGLNATEMTTINNWSRTFLVLDAQLTGLMYAKDNTIKDTLIKNDFQTVIDRINTGISRWTLSGSGWAQPFTLPGTSIKIDATDGLTNDELTKLLSWRSSFTLMDNAIIALKAKLTATAVANKANINAVLTAMTSNPRKSFTIPITNGTAINPVDGLTPTEYNALNAWWNTL